MKPSLFRRVSRQWGLAILGLSVVAASMVAAGASNGLVSFNSGDVIRASDVNANFQAMASSIRETRPRFLKGGSAWSFANPEVVHPTATLEVEGKFLASPDFNGSYVRLDCNGIVLDSTRVAIQGDREGTVQLGVEVPSRPVIVESVPRLYHWLANPNQDGWPERFLTTPPPSPWEGPLSHDLVPPEMSLDRISLVTDQGALDLVQSPPVAFSFRLRYHYDGSGPDPRTDSFSVGVYDAAEGGALRSNEFEDVEWKYCQWPSP